MNKQIVLGFSGGLDTSYCVKYLTEDRGFDVHSIIVNTGGFSEVELQQIEAHAYKLGVKTHVAINAVEGYYDSIIKYLIYGNVLKNNTYPLSVSAERLSQALHIAEHAKKLNATAVAHGSMCGSGSHCRCWLEQPSGSRRSGRRLVHAQRDHPTGRHSWSIMWS